MKCPDCNSELKAVPVKVEDAKSKVVSFQCKKCGHFEFEQKSADKVVEEIKAKEFVEIMPALTLRQKIIKLSKDRLGFYFSKDVVRSAGLRAGEAVEISMPDRKHILLKLE